MDEKNYETRHLFLAIAIFIPIFGPIFLLFLPQTVANIFHYRTGDWYVFSPGENTVIYGIAFLLLFISALILFFFDMRITLNHDQNEDKTVLTFHFTDGNQMNLESTKYLWTIQNRFNKKLKEMNLSIESIKEK
ncbi:hypothetical protein [Robertmurraya sp. P23]|uniref:hypothetical protein n=1 Tax=Robertmurraya sp. P23 TaxID=3436931 RepID=UPI003D99B776